MADLPVPNSTMYSQLGMKMPTFGPEGSTERASDMYLRMNAEEDHAHHHHPLNETPALMYFFVVCLSIQAFTGSLGNILVIGSVFVEDALRHTGNAFIVNLAIADFFITAVAIPSNALGALYGEVYFVTRPIYCSVVSTLCATGCLASCWNMAMIALNRYILICQYEMYDKIYTPVKTGVMCVAVWIVIYLIELPNHVGWGDLRFSRLFFVCTFANHVHSYALFYVLFGVFFPLTVCFSCYLGIYLKVKDSKLTRSRILYSGSASKVTETDKANATPNSIKILPVPLTSAVSKKFYDDLLIIQALFRVLIVYVVMWLPLITLIVLHLEQDVSYVWYILVLLTAHGNSSVNYMVYALTIEHFRRGYIKLLCLKKCFDFDKPHVRRPSRLSRVKTSFKRKMGLEKEVSVQPLLMSPSIGAVSSLLGSDMATTTCMLSHVASIGSVEKSH